MLFIRKPRNLAEVFALLGGGGALCIPCIQLLFGFLSSDLDVVLLASTLHDAFELTS